ncbi:MAG: hypothetical protein GXP14_01900 [Gammaproteobacteria bacterium]|nr:hypothetical protein [Gammaproteobacteria bacterium]
MEKIILFLRRVGQPVQMEKAARWVSLGLLLILMYSLAQLTWLLVPTPDNVPYVALPVAHSSSGNTTQTSGVDIAALNLFGKPGAIEQAPRAQPVKIADTDLKLTLRGILASGDVTVARAIIADDRARKEDLYKIGSKVPGGAILEEVNAEHIVLSRSGRLEILRLPNERLSAGLGMARQTNPSRQNSLATTNSQSGFDANASLREVRDSLMRDPQSLALLMAAEPQVGADGKVTGFKLGQGQDARILRRFGLRRGDVVTMVNGVQLNGLNKLPELMKVLPSAQKLTIEYQRRGKMRSVVLNMDQ